MTEIEAKFLLRRPRQLRKILGTFERLGYTVHEGGTESIADCYYDTKDWALYRAGWSCRWRRRAADRTLTLKSLASGGGGPVFVREEIEQQLPPDQDFAAEMPPGPAVDRLRGIIAGRPGHELFRVLNERTRYRVERTRDSHLVIELAVDRARIVTPDSDASAFGFTELELELKTGAAEALDATARELHDRLGLVTARMSKFERGLQAAGLEPAEHTAPVELKRRDPLLDLVYRHFESQLEEIERQRPLAAEGLHPEGVHRMRIAIRRIRALLRISPPAFPEPELQRFDAEFRWLGRALGRSRDATVQCAALAQVMPQISGVDPAGLEAYARYLADESWRARRELSEVLDGQRSRQLLSAFRQLLAAGPPPAARRRFGDVRIGDAADVLVRKALRKLVKDGDRITEASPPAELHAVRIRAKRARYALECFRDFYADRLKKQLQALRDLQDVLGDYQDTFTASKQLQSYVDSLRVTADTRRELVAIGALLQFEGERRKRARARFPKVWRKLKSKSRLRLRPQDRKTRA